MNKKKNNKKGFDNEKYVKTQIETIKKRIKHSGCAVDLSIGYRHG